MKSYKHYIVDNHKIKEAALLRQPLFFSQNKMKTVSASTNQLHHMNMCCCRYLRKGFTMPGCKR